MSKIDSYLKRFGVESATTIIESSSQFVERISREYGMYVLDSRAIPATTDGLKSAQRIALWLIRNKASEVKTVSLSGEMLGSKLYVHGDVSASDTVSKLAAPYLNNYPLIQGEGQFGTRVAPVDGIGSARYTDVKRSKFAEQYLYVDLDIIPMVENYDGSVLMPKTFLPLIPLVLLNGVTGIAVGWSTEILPRRLEDVQEAVREYLDTGTITNSLMPHYERYDVDVVRMAENPNQYMVKGRLEIKNTSTVVITELPPDLTLDKFKERLIAFEEEDKITDFTDRTRDKINIEIKMRRSQLEGKTVANLIEFFKLRTMVTERIVVQGIDGSTIRQYKSAEDLIKDFVDWRLGWFKTRYEFMLKKQEEESIFWLSMLACFEPKTGKAVASQIATIKSKAALKLLIEGAVIEADIPLEPDVIEKIINLPVYRWTKEGHDETLARLEECHTKITEYAAIIANPGRQRKIYLDEVGK